MEEYADLILDAGNALLAKKHAHVALPYFLRLKNSPAFDKVIVGKQNLSLLLDLIRVVWTCFRPLHS